MRPAVYASVMRNRKSGTRRVLPTPHVYSWQRFFVMLFVGAVLFIPGLIVTIIGIEYNDNLDEIPGDRVLYKFIGPASLACGVCLICASGIYYCCWGVQSPVSSTRARKHKKTKEKTEQSDPLQATVPTISNERNAKSPYSSVRSHGSSPSGHDGHTSSAPNTPNQRSGRHNSGTNRHRSSSQSSTHSSRNHSHHNSRHRNTSQSHQSQHSHNSHHSPTHKSPQLLKDNQVPFVHTSAPLAQGETGHQPTRLNSMDISIDIDNIDDDKKY
ncbi:uncharacterized protein LOC132714349 isoform X2 [Ruditapes philippinarum]|uniref:uncharacterized protein LOC132714349 isoform X2 n=1 Tax=Ruditapes philippinarum TaxID=129788 RepID=UPI00295AF7F5|nr:uncharacterized protein LOC132714349 isoform X2 [Ruditapes philippinarum]